MVCMWSVNADIAMPAVSCIYAGSFLACILYMYINDELEYSMLCMLYALWSQVIICV